MADAEVTGTSNFEGYFSIDSDPGTINSEAHLLADRLVKSSRGYRIADNFFTGASEANSGPSAAIAFRSPSSSSPLL